jgi:type VI secretion system secreted protein Hcp
MAETVHLFLKANGKDIKGDSLQKSLGRENSIECLEFSESVRTAREAGSGMATGRRQYEPLMIVKRLDKATPLLAKALCNNETIDGVFKFFRPNPAGDGTTEHFFTVSIKGGRIASQKLMLEANPKAEPVDDPPHEEVGFIFHTIEWTFTNGGVTHQDSWAENK